MTRPFRRPLTRLEQGALLGLLLGASALLRVVLVLRGGQRYWPDEVRFLRSWELLARVLAGEWAAAIDQLAGTPDHTGFSLAGLVPAWVQASVLWLVGEPIDLLAIERSLRVPALLLSMASVAIVALVFAIARRVGAGMGEALLAAGLAAGANTLFYHSRHLLPYDAALSLALASLWVGLVRRPGLRRSLASGLLAGGALLIYHGYWVSVAMVGALHVAAGEAALRERVQRALGFTAGLVTLPLLLTAASVLRGLPFYPAAIADFSRLAATQSDMSEGWSLPFAYLWHAEHGLAIAWAVGALAALHLGLRRSDEVRPRARLWLCALAGIYLALVALSVGLDRIGVFGRSVRQIVPFACLASAVPAAAWLRSGPRARRLGLAVGLLLALQSAWNFATPLAQAFPAGVLSEVARDHGFVARDVTVTGTSTWDVPSVPWPAAAPGPDTSAPRPDSSAPGPDTSARLVLLNAQHLYPVRGARLLPPGVVLRSWRHPLEFPPYQYEGYTPRERAILRNARISMRLVELSGVPAAAGRAGKAD